MLFSVFQTVSNWSPFKDSTAAAASCYLKYHLMVGLLKVYLSDLLSKILHTGDNEYFNVCG